MDFKAEKVYLCTIASQKELASKPHFGGGF